MGLLDPPGVGRSIVKIVIKPSGDVTGAKDTAAINAALIAAGYNGLVTLDAGQFYTNAPIRMQSNTRLHLDDALVLLVNGSNCWMITNRGNSITGGTCTPDVNIAVTGAGRAAFVGQTGSLLAADASSGSSTLSLAAPVSPGLFYVGQSYDTSVETVTVTSVTGSSAPYTAQLAAPLSTTHTVSVFSWLASQRRVQTNRYLSAGVQFVMVTGLTLSGVKIGPSNFVMTNLQACANVKIRDVTLNADGVTPNQDGIDIWGCQNVSVGPGIRGFTGDDFSYIASQITTPAIVPYLRSTGTMPNTVNISYTDCEVEPSANFIRIIAGDGLSVSGIRGANLRNLGRNVSYGRLVKSGPAAFLLVGGDITANGAPATVSTTATLTDVKISDYYPGQFRDCVFLASASNIRLEGGHQAGPYQFAMLAQGSSVPITVNDVTFANRVSADPSVTASNIEDLIGIGFASGTAINGLKVRQVHLTQARSLLNIPTGVSLTSLNLKGISIGTALAALFTGSGTWAGFADGIDVDTYSAGVTPYVKQLKLKMGLGMPVVSATDAVPVPTVGSLIQCVTGVDPTGGSSTTAGMWVGDGTAWNRLLSYATASMAAPSAPTATVGSVTYSSAGMTWTAPSTGSPTSYNVYRGTTSGAETLLASGITATSYTDGAVSPSTVYYYKIAGVNAAGAGALSNEITATTPAAPAGNTFADAFPTGDSASWTSTAVAGTTPATFTAASGVLSISGTSATAAGTYLRIPAFAASSATNVFAQQTVSAASSAPTPAHPRLALNYTDPLNYYFGYYDVTAAAWKIYKTVGGTTTSIGTFPDSVPSVPYSLQFQNVAGTLTVLANGVNKGSVADSSLTGTGVGVAMRAGGAAGANTVSETQHISGFSAGPVS